MVFTSMVKKEELILKSRLKVARAEWGISQRVLADKVRVSRQTISANERGEFNPSAKLALLLCISLDKTLEEFFHF